MFRRILVAIDGSKASEKATEIGIDLALKYGAKLTFLHSLGYIASVGNISDLAQRLGFQDEVREELEQIAEVPLKRIEAVPAAATLTVPFSIVEKVGAQLIEHTRSAAKDRNLEDVESILEVQDPARAILNCASERSVDLIVIGSRGFGDWKSIVLGSVSHKIIHEATCPCLVIK